MMNILPQESLIDLLAQHYHAVSTLSHSNIGIKHGFSCINIRQVPWEVLKTKAEGRVFHLSQGTWRMLMH